MTEQDILKLVEETFKEDIFIQASTPHAIIGGTERFMKRLELKLSNLFDENDLSKIDQWQS